MPQRRTLNIAAAAAAGNHNHRSRYVTAQGLNWRKWQRTSFLHDSRHGGRPFLSHWPPHHGLFTVRVNSTTKPCDDEHHEANFERPFVRHEQRSSSALSYLESALASYEKRCVLISTSSLDSGGGALFAECAGQPTPRLVLLSNRQVVQATDLAGRRGRLQCANCGDG